MLKRYKTVKKIRQLYLHVVLIQKRAENKTAVVANVSL